MKLYYNILATLVAGSSLVSCSDDLSGSDWQPGEISDAAGIYFSPDNSTYIALLDGDKSVVELKVHRLDSKGAIDVPVIVKEANDQMRIPEKITFEDGQTETTLTIDCSEVPAIVEHKLCLTFPDTYINPYAAGSPEYDGSLIVSRWENVSETGTTEFIITTWNYADAGYDHMNCQLTHLLGSNRYRVSDFMNTGLTFEFTIMPSPYKDGQYRIIPLSNNLLLSDYGWGDLAYYNAWWLVGDGFDLNDEDTQEWPVVTLTKPGGIEYDIYYLQFLWYDEASKADYCYILNYDKGKPTAYMAFYGNTDEDMSGYTSYMRLKFSWTEQ